MNEPPIDIDAVPWKKIGRRWRTVLCAMLFINGVTVVWAVCDKAMTAPEGTAMARAAETQDVAATAEQPAAAESDGPAPANATQPEIAIEAPRQVVASAQSDEQTSTGTPVVVALDGEPPSNHDAELDLAGTLLIINPPTTGGVVHYMVDDQSVSLMPSEYRRLSVDDKLRVQYHRGGDLANEAT